MIQLCSCSQAATSTPELPKKRRGSNACGNCGGERLVDVQGAESKGMVSAVVMELSRATDTHLSWRTASNGRHRSTRRARTSFPGLHEKHIVEKVPKQSGDLICREQKFKKDMLVSESEKLGISVLGMHFSDTRQFVPIKKRRFMLVCSTPPSKSPFHPDDYGEITENQSASHEETGSNAGRIPEFDSATGAEQGQNKIFVNENCDLARVNEKSCKSEDFSGISILAAVACDSNIDRDLSNTSGSAPKEPSFKREGNSRRAKPLSVLIEKNEQLSETLGPLDDKVDAPVETLSTLVVAGNVSDGNNAEVLLSDREPTSSLHTSQDKLSKINSPSQSNRLYWDLNTSMDTWEIPLTEVKSSKSLAANIVRGDSISDERLVKYETREGQALEVDCTSHLDFVPRNNCAIQELGEQEKLTSFCDDLAAGHEESKQCHSVPCEDGLARDVHVLKDVAADMEKEKADANHVIPCEDNFVREEHGLKDTVVVMEEEKADSRCVIDGLMAGDAMPPFHCVPVQHASSEQSIHAFEPEVAVAQRTTELITGNIVSASLPDVPKDNCCPDAVLKEGISQDMKDVDDSETCEIHQYTSVSCRAKESSDAVVHSNTCSSMTTDGMSTKISLHEACLETTCDHDNKSKEVETSLHLPGSHAFTSQGSSTYDQASSGSASIGEIVRTIGREGYKSSMLPDVKIDASKYHQSVHIGSKVLGWSSEAMMPDITDRSLPDSAVCFQGTCKSSFEGYANRQSEADLNDHLESGYDSNASHINANHRIGLEKGELSGDEDSQYEDGELRESFSWGEYGDEGGELEPVDYEPEDRVADVFESAECPAPHADGIKCKNQWFSEIVNVHLNGAQVGEKALQDDVLQTFVQGSSITDTSDEGSGERSVGSVRRTVVRSEKSNRSLKDGLGNSSSCDKVRGECVDKEKELSHSEALKRKSSGRQSSVDGLVDSRIDSGNQALAGAQLHAFSAGDYRKTLGDLISRRESSSRIERPRLSNLPFRKERSSRSSGEPNDTSPRFGGDSRTPRSFGKGGLSLRVHHGGGGERWADSLHYRGPSHHDSSGYYGPASFSNCVSRNAVAVTAAKVESNGFVVAPDGTLVKSDGGHADRGPRQSADAFLHSGRPFSRRNSPVERDGPFAISSRCRNLREMSPDRDIYFNCRNDKYGPSIVRTSHRERYRRSLRDTDYPLSMRRPSSMRERSFSPPNRRPPYSSRSPSRSRSRSPRLWRSSKGRNEYGINETTALRMHTRSPSSFGSVARLERVKSPHQPTDLDRVIGYGPLRNRTSSPHVPSLIAERDELPGRMRGHGYRRPSGRSPPRDFTKSSRPDNMSSQGILRQDEYFRPNQAVKSADFVDAGRGSRHKRDNDRRGHADRLDASHSSRQHYSNGNTKHFCNDAEDNFQGANSETSISRAFKQRGSSRDFLTGIESQDNGASPERVREEKGHPGDGKHHTAFKTIADKDADEDMASRGQ